MSAQESDHGFEFACDSCGEVFVPPRLGRGSAPRSFQESLALAKEAGFRAYKNQRGDWLHRCKGCSERKR